MAGGDAMTRWSCLPTGRYIRHVTLLWRLGSQPGPEYGAAAAPRRGPDVPAPTTGHERMSPCPSSRSVSSRSGSRSRGGGGFFHSDHMTFAYYEIEAGSEVHLHHHPQE